MWLTRKYPYDTVTLFIYKETRKKYVKLVYIQILNEPNYHYRHHFNK